MLHNQKNKQIIKRQAEWKGAGKDLHKVFKAVVNEISQELSIFGELVA